MMTRMCVLAVCCVIGAAAPPLAAQLPRTGAEHAAFGRHTSHDELLQFLYDVQSRTSNMLIRHLARTDEGRVMPLVILGSPATATPATAWFSGKPTLFITGNVHGGERAGREGSLQLIRELALGSARPLLERVNVLIVPTLNPDGAERRSRTNTLGYDMNRDFIVAETPEIRAILEHVLLEWWPDVYVDVHNGGAYPYHVTYQATLHPAADAELVRFARGPMFDGVKRHLATQQMRTHWYSGPRQEDDGRWSWQTTEPWARKQHSYGGLQNMITLLFEIPGRWTLQQQTDNAREGMVGLLRFVAENAGPVRKAVVDARQRTLQSPPDRVVISVAQSAYPQPEQFYVMQNNEERLVTGSNRTLYVAAATRARPWAYAFDASLNKIAAFLRRHAIEVERLDAPTSVRAEKYRVTKLAWATEPYQNHLLADAEIEVVADTMTLSTGTYLVRMSQNAARLIAELMEPDTDDSLITWNFLDHSLPAPRTIAERQAFLPIYRITAPASVRATLID